MNVRPLLALKRLWWYLSGRIVIEPPIMAADGPWVLFMSDTPSMLFPEIKRLIQGIQPKYIVHTGDLVDDLKLQIYPRLIDNYDKMVAKLIETLDASAAERVIIALGNHDILEVVKKHAKRIEVYPHGANIELDGRVFSLSHYYKIAKEMELAAENHPQNHYLLFGHDLVEKSHLQGHPIHLNGIEGIYLISLTTRQIRVLQYPSGTENARLNRYRIGL